MEVFLILILVGSGITIWVYCEVQGARAAAHQKYLSDCKQKYFLALSNMATDSQARAAVVYLGRVYYGALRGTGPTVYDEMAIMNDIKAAGG